MPPPAAGLVLHLVLDLFFNVLRRAPQPQESLDLEATCVDECRLRAPLLESADSIVALCAEKDPRRLSEEVRRPPLVDRPWL